MTITPYNKGGNIMNLRPEQLYRDFLLLDETHFILKYGNERYLWMKKATYLFEIKEEMGITNARINQLLNICNNTTNTHYRLYFRLKEELKDKIVEKQTNTNLATAK